MSPSWHLISAKESVSSLGGNALSGLDEREAARRIERDGRNELLDPGLKSSWKILRAQVSSTMFALLATAAGVSLLLRDFSDALAILAIMLVNLLLGFVQEYRADRAIATLKKLAVSRCKVVRSGRLLEIDPAQLVAGDLMPLEAGVRVPADGRLLQSMSLRCEEASLTGESEPVDKTVEAMGDPGAQLGDRRNMVYLGTSVVSGRGLAVVTATGMRTEMGLIAGSLRQTPEELTPLQRKLEKMARALAWAVVVVVSAFFIFGLIRGEPPMLMFLTAVSMAVAAVPEGLPAVIVATLAIAARKMLSRKALVRKLTAVEGLGSVTVICCDKTGTLTENKMTAVTLELTDRKVPFDQSVAIADPQTALVLTAAALCNDAYLLPGGNGQIKAAGDPTEAALVVAAARMGLKKDALDSAFPRLGEEPFDPGRKRMSTAHSLDARELDALKEPALRSVIDAAGLGDGGVFAKGSVDSLLHVCTRLWERDEPVQMTDDWRTRIRACEAQMAADGMRVIGVAYRPLVDAVTRDYERDLTFLGCFGLLDPPRPDIKEAISACRAAGIKLVMITGDHPLTARSIAEALGIPVGERILTGRDLGAMSKRDLERIVDKVSIYARVSPEHKLKIVTALQAQGHIVAMTGDGINDGPALKKADIGVAMGITGTDVAKEAAAMVLLDDRFPTIVAAVMEGRVVYDNIRKFLKFLMATNVAELAIMLVAPLLGMPLPFTPIQILWINLLTDGPPALALGFETAELGVMTRPPRVLGESLFNGRMIFHILWVSALMAGIVLASGGLSRGSSHLNWQSEMLMTLVLTQMAHVLAIRSEASSFNLRRVLENWFLLGAVALTILLQLAVLFVPAFQGILRTAPLALMQIVRALALSGVVFGAVEVEKLFLRWKGPNQTEGGKSTYRIVRRVIVIASGFVILATGVAMIVLPGPAILVIPIGLGVLSGEFLWARRLLAKITALKDFGPVSWKELKGLLSKRNSKTNPITH